uniref:Uncharacterized protein n=1 Tax=Panagrolaimus superbus TaxID=310955 RepID=A0A914YGM2_9BILA
MSNMQRINKANKLHSQLKKTTNVEDRIKLHQEAIKMIEGRENEDPDEDIDNHLIQRENAFGIQSIPLLSTNSRGATLSSFDPSTTEGITSSTSNESLHRQKRVRRNSVSSESSTSSAGRTRKSASRNASLTHIPALSHERLTPDAEKRVFNYNYRGPIPTKHHCQRSLFGKTVEVEPVETPKKRIQSKNRTPLRQHTHEHQIPTYHHRPGMHLHESSCDAARQLQASKSSANVATKSKSFDSRKTPPRFNKGSHDNLFQSSAKRRLDAWKPIERSKSSHSVKPLSSSTPTKRTEEDSSDGYAIPSVSELDRTLLKTPVRREITPPELYKTPAVHQEGNAKEFQTPLKSNVFRSGKQRFISKETLQDETEAEIAAIDTVLANLSPSRSKIPKLVSRQINLTPSTDYRNLKDTSVEKNFEEVQAAIKSKSKDKNETVQEVLKDKIEELIVTPGPKSKVQSPALTPVLKNKSGEGNVSSLKSSSKISVSTDKIGESFVTPSSKDKIQDIQISQLYQRNVFSTPKTSKTNESTIEMTPNTKFRTSLSREKLIKGFKEALDINICAKKRFLKYERQYFEKIRDLKKLDRIDKEMEKFSNIIKKATEDVKSATLDYSENVWRKVLAETEKLQNDAKEFVIITNENKEKRRRKLQNFGVLGDIDANEFERKHFESLSRRHENALRLSEAVKKVNIERAIVELQERKAIKDLVRLSLDNKTIAGISQSTSVTESTVTRRSVTLTSTEIRKLAEDAMNNKRKLGKVVSKPELAFIEQESENISERKSLSSAGIILSSRHHARIIETQITEKLFISDNFIQIPQSGISSAASSIIPRLDFSVLEDSASNKVKTSEPFPNIDENNLIEDIVIPDIKSQSSSKTKQKDSKNSNRKTERSDGRTSRDVSSISEFEPPPADVEPSSNDDKKTENDVSTIRDIEESVHNDVTITQDSTTNHAESQPIEHLHTPSEESIFSALPSTHSHDDLQSLPDPLSAKTNDSKSSAEKEEESNYILPVDLHQNGDSDPERLPLSATTGTFNASPISSARLLGDSPIPSPPFVAPSISSSIPGEKDVQKSKVDAIVAEEEEESIAELSHPESLHSSKSSSSTTTESSKVVIPSSLENSVHESVKPSVAIVVEHDEKSTTSVSTDSTATTSSIDSVASKTTSSKSSSEPSKNESKPASAKSSDDTSVPEDLPSSAQSNTSSDFSSFLPSNQESKFQKFSNTVVADKKQQTQSPADEISENSFSVSGYSQSNDHHPRTSNRRKSWDMVETGIIGKQSPSYYKNDSVDNDISGIFNNDPPKFESAPSALGPYAAVSPRSPRSEHSRRHSFSRSPPLPKTLSSKTSTDFFDHFLLDDVSLTNVAAPIFDISSGSERGSLGIKDERNLLDWSPGLSRELSQPKVAKKVENIVQEEIESTTETTDETTASTQIEELPLDRSVEATVKEIESFCYEMWPQIKNLSENANLDLLIAPFINSEDPEQRYHDAYRFAAFKRNYII